MTDFAGLLGLRKGSSPTEPPGISLEIDGKQFRGWNKAELKQAIDVFSSVGFSAPFEPDNKEFRQLFRPFSYKTVRLFIDGDLQFTGTLINVEPNAESDKKEISVSSYARPGVIEDCEPPASAYPLEFDGLDILQICQQLCAPFGFTAEVEFESIVRDGSNLDVEFQAKKIKRGKRGGIVGGKGSKFARLALNPGDDLKGFFTGLAKQRGLVLADTPNGDLLLRNSVSPGNPVATFVEGEKSGPVKVTANFNPQEYFSEITAWTPSTRRKKGDKYTEANKRLSGVVRPTSFKPDDTDKSQASDAAKAKMGRMFGNMVGWEMEVPAFVDPSGNQWKPNTTIKLTWPSAYIFKATELLVREVTKTQEGDSFGAKLVLILPGAFSGEIPDSFPWDEEEAALLTL